MQTLMNDSLWESMQQNLLMNQRIPIFYTTVYPVSRNVKHVLTNSANLLTSLFSHVNNQTILIKIFKKAKVGTVSLM